MSNKSFEYGGSNYVLSENAIGIGRSLILTKDTKMLLQMYQDSNALSIKRLGDNFERTYKFIPVELSHFESTFAEDIKAFGLNPKESDKVKSPLDTLETKQIATELVKKDLEALANGNPEFFTVNPNRNIIYQDLFEDHLI